MNKIKLILLFSIFTCICIAQQETVNVDFQNNDWKTFGSIEVIEFDTILTTNIPSGTGIGYLENIGFQNGTIECDLYSPSDKAYLGIVINQ